MASIDQIGIGGFAILITTKFLLNEDGTVLINEDGTPLENEG